MDSVAIVALVIGVLLIVAIISTTYVLATSDDSTKANVKTKVDVAKINDVGECDNASVTINKQGLVTDCLSSTVINAITGSDSINTTPSNNNAGNVVNIALANTTVLPGTYYNSSIIVNATGQITAIGEAPIVYNFGASLAVGLQRFVLNGNLITNGIAINSAETLFYAGISNPFITSIHIDCAPSNVVELEIYEDFVVIGYGTFTTVPGNAITYILDPPYAISPGARVSVGKSAGSALQALVQITMSPGM